MLYKKIHRQYLRNWINNKNETVEDIYIGNHFIGIDCWSLIHIDGRHSGQFKYNKVDSIKFK